MRDRLVSALALPRIHAELEWLLPRVEAAGFVRETERIGVGDIFPRLRLGVHIDGASSRENQTDVTTVMRFGRNGTRLQITNGAIVASAAGPEVGSVLDLDSWAGPADADLFGHGLERFSELHTSRNSGFNSPKKTRLPDQLQPVYP